MKRNNTPAPADKRTLLIGAILSKDTAKLKALSSQGKRVVVLDTFLDALKAFSSESESIPEEDRPVYVCTDGYNKMWDEIKGNTKE